MFGTKTTLVALMKLIFIFSEQLGDRLQKESQSNPKLLQDAQLCYIVAGSFDKLVDSWSTNAKSSTKDLQELVELVTFLQKSIERQGRQVEVRSETTLQKN